MKQTFFVTHLMLWRGIYNTNSESNSYTCLVWFLGIRENSIKV